MVLTYFNSTTNERIEKKILKLFADHIPTDKLINFEDLYDVSIRDIQGKIVHKLYNLSNNHFTLRSSIISRGVYWVILDNHPTIKPLKLIVQ